ncbi:unnamed protein product [Brachionus calyciflorus]|uniref:FLYWCH-type domain-containing protein n=1 Tax=Brachionus calyciflorus TaxID=104777 RepID=A0A814DKF4_9BILA|nr:unnamed protein product [Brachionus calyciflorus]
MTDSNLADLMQSFENFNLKTGFVTSSQKSSPQLSIDGYFFRISGDAKAATVNWRCIKTNLYCKAKCYTLGCNIGSEYTVYFNDDDDQQHSHGPDATGLAIKERRRILKERTGACAMSVPNVAPRQIFTSLVGCITSPDTIAALPSYDAERQVINRTKKSIRPDYPSQPETLKDIIIPDFLTLNLLNEPFLLHDSGVDDPDGYLIFASMSYLKLLENNDVFADGTFDIAPKLFKQVYTIHALFHGRCLPVAYCLLTRKTEKLYTTVLNSIKSHLASNPKSITSDYELAFINAAKKVLQCTIYGCFFHYKQAMFRLIQDLGLAVPYASCEKTRHFLKLPQVLAFVPIDEVFNKFNQS